MLAELRKMFEKPPAVEIYDLVDTLHSCKQAPGKSVSEHVLEMKGLMDQLHTLGKPYDNDMSTVSDLHALLIDYEKGLKDKVTPTPQVFSIQKGRDNKSKPQGNKQKKGKGKADKNKQLPSQPKPNPKKRKENPNKDQACHHCHMTGHWKRNCPLYLEELRANKKKSEHSAAGSGINAERKLAYGDQYLHMGNGAQAVVEAIGTFDLVLPSGLVLKLNNCYFAPSIVRGVVSFSCLLDLGFKHTVASNGISVSLNGVFYFSAISVNGVFEIDMNKNVTKNNNSVFSINKKRKLDLDSSYLWHCRLAHIGKTRMQKPSNVKRLWKVSMMNQLINANLEFSGKMTKKPFNSNIERATDLLGLIHTDVCGPLRHVSRKGASYFLTFTDDFSRYGYVYLLKHKHEVFETFKVFKAEVELQLGKKIKALRSDRGDMVRSMFNLTTLPLSFWDYALESAVRILNMVPTKKVDKTPYEIWHGKRSVKCIFVGYPKETMGYYFYFPPENKVIVARIYHVAVRCTRPDVAFAQNLVSRYQQNPGKLHWVAVKHILKYLRNTKDMFLVYGGNPDTELDVTEALDGRARSRLSNAMHATQSEYMARQKLQWKQFRD
ncbi:retrotransposon protein, putative, ty1-copia subclass [Tanacetum coccineum]